ERRWTRSRGPPAPCQPPPSSQAASSAWRAPNRPATRCLPRPSAPCSTVADQSTPPPDRAAAPRPAFARESAALRLSDVVSLADLSPEWAWGGATGRGVRVAVVDSGIEADHPSLEGCVDGEH